MNYNCPKCNREVPTGRECPTCGLLTGNLAGAVTGHQEEKRGQMLSIDDRIVDAYKISGLLKVGQYPSQDWIEMGKIAIEYMLAPDRIAEQLRKAHGLVDPKASPSLCEKEITVTEYDYDGSDSQHRLAKTTVTITRIP